MVPFRELPLKLARSTMALVKSAPSKFESAHIRPRKENTTITSSFFEPKQNNIEGKRKKFDSDAGISFTIAFGRYPQEENKK